MIFLGIMLLIIGIFVARNILWPIGGVLILIGLLLLLLTPGYAYY
jgi:hypothetical protein